MKYLLIITMAIYLPFSLFAQLSLSRLVGDHMVLQRNQENPIWGWSKAGDRIEVEFLNKSYQATAGADGRWEVKLPAMKEGGPHELMVKNETTSISISDIYFGEVWVCSGQSNMEWLVKNSNDAKQVIDSANDPMIRHFKVPLKGSLTLEKELPGGEWVNASPETVGDFTAVGYFFAQHLRENLNVPIGLINTSWGGSSIEAWMSAEIQDGADVNTFREKQEKERLAVIKKLEGKAGKLPLKDLGIVDGLPIWAGNEWDDTGWNTMILPQLWEGAGLDGLDGIVWFRKAIELPESATKQGLSLSLAKIDDSDQVWVNGKEVGSMKNAYSSDRKYSVPAEYLKTGKNTITIRVEDTGGGGGIYGDAAAMMVSSPGFSLSLAGEWKYKIGEYRESVSNVNHTPTMLYNYMIHPMLGYGIRGAIWYQGESNAAGNRAVEYRNQFPAMIKNWRDNWKQGDFPFLFVQLANFKAPFPEPADSDWAVLRESQTETLSRSPKTGQAVIIDIGEANDIHPRNKQDVGHRLALAARKIAYNEDVVYSGPVYKSHSVKGNEVTIEFDHIGSGLTVKDKYGYVKGFSIAGTDQKFYWAKGRIENNKVVIWSDKVSAPANFRYAWADNPDDANLYNKEGLPATPFRR